MSKNKPDPTQLLQTAATTGAISPSSLAALDIVDVGAQIQAGLGVGVDDIAASEVLLLSMMPDDSSSIAMANNIDAVIEGHNQVVAAMRASKQSSEVLCHTRYLNGTVLYPYTTLDNAVTMSRQNYDPTRATPLYDQTAVMLGTVIAKTAELYNAGISVRTVTLLITDGDDCGSQRCDASDVRRLVQDMLRQECHTIAAMGISDGRTDFARIFAEMGIPSRWVLTPGNSPSEIRRAFAVFSQSAARATVGGGFAFGGFGN